MKITTEYLRDANLRDADLSGADLSSADLSGADLSGANLSSADLGGANLSSADLSSADLSDANLGDANLSYANLSYANLSSADLRYADLSDANLSSADLGGADLGGADLSDANLSYANLSSAEGLLSAVDFMEKHFERTEAGYLAYKTFELHHAPPAGWPIESNAILSEVVNYTSTADCGCGINVATLDWVKSHSGSSRDIWKVLIEWPWLAGVCVPLNSDGKIRCEKVRLLEIVK